MTEDCVETSSPPYPLFLVGTFSVPSLNHEIAPFVSAPQTLTRWTLWVFFCILDDHIMKAIIRTDGYNKKNNSKSRNCNNNEDCDDDINSKNTL